MMAHVIVTGRVLGATCKKHNGSRGWTAHLVHDFLDIEMVMGKGHEAGSFLELCFLVLHGT